MIPKKLGHIWIGPFDPPTNWMTSWIDKHPDWEYRLYDNDYLVEREFICQKQIVEYFERGMYPGVSDLIRYQILYEHGGFLPEADSICLNPTDELFTEEKCYTVYELPNGKSGMVSPFLASNKENRLLMDVLNHLRNLDPKDLNRPWNSVGNGFLRRFLRRYDYGELLTIFPSHYFIPNHIPRKIFYSGDEKIYADQMWGTTTRNYPHSRGRTNLSIEEIEDRKSDILKKIKKFL